MKKFLKLLSVVVTFGLVGCTNDATEDVALNVPASGPEYVTRTLGVALDGGTRLELGDKTAEGKYPVKWTEGDILGVNGLPSSGAVVAADPSVATFDFQVAADTVEYHIVYPYVEGAVGSGPKYSVVSFAAEQYYTEGTFDPASFPLQGYAKGKKSVDEATGEVVLEQPVLTGLKLNYLAGVLRFEMTAEEAVTLTKLDMRSTSGKLSGLFDTNCSVVGGLAPQATASDSMSYIFADGLELTPGTTKVFYVAVPKGDDHSSIRIKFCTTDPTVGMVAGFAVEEIKAGVVTEFKTVTFKNNLAEYEDTIFEIKDEASLMEFSIKASKGLLSYAEVNVTNNVTVSAENAAAWTPIEDFRGVINGGDFTIKGLTKPMFNKFCGKVSNLTIDSNVVSDTENATAILARCVGSGAEVAFVTTKGSVKHTLATSTYGVFSYVGGVAGYTSGTYSIHDCTNLATVTMDLTQVETKKKATYIGGILSCSTGTITEPACTFYNNTNGSASDPTLGSVIVKGSYPWALVLYGGGVMGRISQSSIQAKDLTNYANVDFDVADLPGYANVGGVVGYITQVEDAANTPNLVHERFKNYGKINFKHNGKHAYRVSGVVGYAAYCTMDDLQNMEGADVTVNGVSGGALTGGVLAGTAYSEVSNIVNRGNVYVKVDASSVSNGLIQVAGCVTQSSTGGNIDTATNYGTVTLDEGSKCYRALVAGCLAYQSGGAIKNATNAASGSVVNNAVTTNYMGAGGCIGYATGSGSDNSDNAASVTVGGSSGQNLYVGGCVALGNTPMGSDNTNTGAVYSTNTTTGEVHVGGLVGRLYPAAAYEDGLLSDSSNSGSVTVLGTCGKASYVYVGGAIGLFANYTENYELNNVNNLADGDVLVAMKANAYPQYVGGIVGRNDEKALVIKNCDNAASVSVKDSEGSTATGHIICVGGIQGFNNAAVTIDDCHNTGAIYCNRTLGATQPCVAGIHGRAGAAFTIKNCTNSGAVECASINGNGWLMVAGITGGYGAASTIHDCSNSGNITYSGTIGDNKVPYIAGCVASLLATNYNVKNLTNTGVVTLSGDATKATGETAIGGIIGKITAGGVITGTLSSGSRINGYEGDDEPYTTNVVVTGKFGCLYAGGIIGNIAAGANAKVDLSGVTKIGVYGKVLVTDAATGTTAYLAGVTGKHTATTTGSSITEYSDVVDNRAGLPRCDSASVPTVKIAEQYNK